MTYLVIAQMLPKKFSNVLMADAKADGETYMLMTYVRILPKLGVLRRATLTLTPNS